MSLVPGQQVEEFLIAEVLSSTVHGNVYRARDTSDGSTVVLKEIFYSARGPELEARGNALVDALEFLEQIDHPYLAVVYGFFSTQSRAFIVMEDVEGKTLRALRRERAMSGIEIAAIMHRICRGLECLQEWDRKYLFGALTPSHIIIDRNGDPHLINYGLGRFFRPFPPQSALRETFEEVREDLNALARVLFFALMGREGDMAAISDSLRIMPVDFKTVFSRFTKDEHPYTNVMEMRLAFQEILERAEPGESETLEAPGKDSLVEECQKESGDRIIELLRKMRQAEEKAQEPSEEALRHEAPPEVMIEEEEAKVDAPVLSEEPAREGKAAPKRQRWKVPVIMGALILLFIAFFQGLAPGLLRLSGRVLVLCAEGRICIHDSASGAMLRDIATGEDLSDLCSPAGMRTVFAAAPRAKKILLLKPDTLEIAGELSVDGAPERVTPDPSGQRIFVLCPRGNLLSIISLSDRKNIDILIPGQPKSMAYDAEKQLLYVASRDTGMLHVVDMKTTKLRPAERALPEEPVALALSPDGTELWTAQWKTSTVSTVDTSTFSVKGALILKDKTPCALAFSPDGLYVYAALFDSGEVGRFPVHREEVGKDLFASSGRKPSALAFDPRGRLWIANRGADTLACFNGRGLTRCKELKTGKNPFRIAFVPQ